MAKYICNNANRCLYYQQEGCSHGVEHDAIGCGAACEISSNSDLIGSKCIPYNRKEDEEMECKEEEQLDLRICPARDICEEGHGCPHVFPHVKNSACDLDCNENGSICIPYNNKKVGEMFLYNYKDDVWIEIKDEDRETTIRKIKDKEVNSEEVAQKKLLMKFEQAIDDKVNKMVEEVFDKNKELLEDAMLSKLEIVIGNVDLSKMDMQDKINKVITGKVEKWIKELELDTDIIDVIYEKIGDILKDFLEKNVVEEMKSRLENVVITPMNVPRKLNIEE